MKLMKTEDAVGQMLCHDITQIIKDVKKGPVFRKGHIITEEDVPVLLSVGKDHIYIWEVNEKMMHENDAALVLYDMCKNEHIYPSEDIKEGKVEVFTDCDGVLKIDSERLCKLNSLGEMMIASRHGNTPVKAGDKLAAMRIIPLIIEKEKMEKATAAVAGGQILSIMPYKHHKVGIVTTGNEVYHHRIEDTFTPVILDKLSEFDVEIIGHEVCSDDTDMETAAIQKLLDMGATMVVCTGGMSVDPDDKTPLAIRTVAPDVVTYGAPVLPGAMFMLSYYKGDVPVVGLPGCVMYAKRTVFDLVLPRLMAGEKLTGKDLYTLGEGGLCLNCKVCTYPNCGFGK